MATSNPTTPVTHATTPRSHGSDGGDASAPASRRRLRPRRRDQTANRRSSSPGRSPLVSTQASSAAARPAETPSRKLARITGLLWIATFITSIPALVLYGPLLHNSNFILGAGGGDARIYTGATLELLLIIANIGTAVVPYALFKRHSERLALGYVAARIAECVFIAVGIVSVLAIMTLRQDPGSASDNTLVALGRSLVAIHDATFLLGPGFVVGVGNGLILGCLMYRSGLVPRRMALFGLVGGPLVCLSGIAVMFGAFEPSGAVQFGFTIPEIIWEAFLGIYLTFKGFNASSPVFGAGRVAAADPVPAVAPA